MPATYHDPSAAGVSAFRQAKLEKECKKNWNLFYKRNGDRFYKDRHWTTREFEELVPACKGGGEQLLLLEVGCGAGNFVFPLIQAHERLFSYACDFSEEAIRLCQGNSACDARRCCFFVADLTSDEFRHQFLAVALPRSHLHVHLISLVFVLSSIHPDKHAAVVANLASVLAPGATLLFRDYAIDDMAMRRFSPDNRISERFFVRQDGTRSFFFDVDSLALLFEGQGFEVLDNRYVSRSTTNVKEGINVERTFIQAKFRRNSCAAASQAQES